MTLRKNLAALASVSVMGVSQNGLAQSAAPDVAATVTLKACFNQIGPYLDRYDAHKRGTRTLAGNQAFIGERSTGFQRHFLHGLSEAPASLLDANVDLTSPGSNGVKHFTGDVKSMTCGDVVKGVIQYGYRPR